MVEGSGRKSTSAGTAEPMVPRYEDSRQIASQETGTRLRRDIWPLPRRTQPTRRVGIRRRLGAGEGRAAERQHGTQILYAGIRLREREQPAAPVRGTGRCQGDNRKPTIRAVDDSVCHRTRHLLASAIVQDAPKRSREMDRSSEAVS